MLFVIIEVRVCGHCHHIIFVSRPLLLSALQACGWFQANLMMSSFSALVHPLKEDLTVVINNANVYMGILQKH